MTALFTILRCRSFYCRFIADFSAPAYCSGCSLLFIFVGFKSAIPLCRNLLPQICTKVISSKTKIVNDVMTMTYYVTVMHCISIINKTTCTSCGPGRNRYRKNQQPHPLHILTLLSFLLLPVQMSIVVRVCSL